MPGFFDGWFHSAVDKPTIIKEHIYTNWRKLLHTDLKDRFGEEKAADTELSKKKVLTYFFPYLILQSSAFIIPDMRKAVELLRSVYHKKNQAKVCIFADSDADGLTSAAILYLFLRDTIGMPIEHLSVLTPGEEDKYGLSEDFVLKIAALEPDLFITLDCGSSDKATLSLLREAMPSLPMIVIDHHTLPAHPKDYPPVDAFVNPKRLAATDENADHCTAALVYKFVRGFLLSFASGYGSIFELCDFDAPLLLQDGVAIPPTAAGQKVSWHKKEGALDLTSLWEQQVATNAQIHQLDKFLKKEPAALSPTEKFFVLQNALAKKTDEKSRFALPFCAAGLVADLMPVYSDNRILINEGLRYISENSNSLTTGFRELLRKLDLLRPGINEIDFAFTLCPALNAADRMGSPLTAFYALTAQDPLEAAQQAHALRELNEQRKKMSRKAVDLLADSLDERHLDYPVVVAYHKEVHRGISGPVANRLAENFHKPAVVLVDDGDSVRGSARSYRNEDIFGFVSSLQAHLLQFGGHRGAAGFSLSFEYTEVFIEEAYRFSHDFFSREEHPQLLDDDETLSAKVVLNEDDLLTSCWESFLAFAPYGKTNPLPEVIVNTRRPFEITYMGAEKNHARIKFSGAPSVDVVWFFEAEKARELQLNCPYRWVCEPSINYFQGRQRFQLKVKSIEKNKEGITNG